MERLVSIITSVLVGISGVAYSQEANVKSGGMSVESGSPSASVSLYLEAIALGEFDFAIALTNSPENNDFSVDLQNLLTISKESADILMEHMFKYEYNILSENIEEDIALVKLELETVDLIVALEQVAAKLLKDLPDEIAEGSEEALEKYVVTNLIEELNNPSAVTKTYEVDVYLEREDEDAFWFVEVSPELATAMLGIVE